MKRLPFVLWMLFYPILNTIERAILWHFQGVERYDQGVLFNV